MHWIAPSGKDAASTLTPGQLAWLNLIPDHIATRLRRKNSVEVERLDLKPLNVRATGSKRVGVNSLHHPVDSFSEVKRASTESIRLSIEPDAFDFAPSSQRGGLGKGPRLFGEQPGNLLEELNQPLVA